MLRIRSSLSIHDDVRVHLAHLVDLDVGHGLIVHLATHIVMLLSLARQHVIVDVCHLLISLNYYQLINDYKFKS